MNSIQKYMDQYSKNLNDYGTYLSPLGTMACNLISGSEVNLISSAVSVAINQLGVKSADFLERNKPLVNRTVAVISGIVFMTVAQSFLPKTDLAIQCLANFGLFVAGFKAVEASDPSRIVPYVRLPASIAFSCLVGEVARQGFKFLQVPSDQIKFAGAFLTMLAVSSVALNDFFYKNTETVTLQQGGLGTQIIKNLNQIRRLKDGRIVIVPNKK